MKTHNYKTTITWTGNTGSGTSSYKGYERSHSITIEGKREMLCSSDPSFNGDSAKYNPEELLLASLSSCHMLWYLALCAMEGIVVVDYKDNANGTMTEITDGSGHFTEVTLHPQVKVLDTSMIGKATELHEKANKMCFIANSVNFPVRHEAKCFAENIV